MVGRNHGKQSPFRFVCFVSSSGHVMFFKSFHKLYLHMRVFKRNLNETILWGNITWHEMG